MSEWSRAKRIGVLVAAAFAGYAAYAWRAVRRFEDLDVSQAPGSFLDVDGERVHYAEAGQGDPVVLIHGWNGSTFSYRYVIPELAQHYRVVALDLRGFGYSERRSDADYSLTGQADLVADAMRRLGIERAHVVGHSMGGAIAMRLAIRHPERVEKLAIADSVSISMVRRSVRWRALLWPLLTLGAPLVLHRPRARRRVLRSAVHDPAVVTAEMEEGYFRPMRMPGHLRALGRQLRNRRSEEALSLGQIQQPTLILWGEHDRWLPPEGGEELARLIPGSRLVLVRSAGHLPFEEQPDASIRELMRFLDDTLGPALAPTEPATELEAPN